MHSSALWQGKGSQWTVRVPSYCSWQDHIKYQKGVGREKEERGKGEDWAPTLWEASNALVWKIRLDYTASHKRLAAGWVATRLNTKRFLTSLWSQLIRLKIRLDQLWTLFCVFPCSPPPSECGTRYTEPLRCGGRCADSATKDSSRLAATPESSDTPGKLPMFLTVTKQHDYIIIIIIN